MYAEDLLKRKGGLFSLTIELADAYDEEEIKKELVDPKTNDPLFLTLREFTSDELVEYLGHADDRDGQVKWLLGKLPDCIVAHNVSGKDGLVDASVVAEIVKSSGSLTMHIVKTWAESLPFARKSVKDSKESPPSSSQAAG